MKIDFAKLGCGPTIVRQVWVAIMEMAISIAKVATANFCTHESLCLLCTKMVLPAIQKCSLTPPANISSTDNSSPFNHLSHLLTPISSCRKPQSSMTWCFRHHTHNHSLTHTQYSSLSPTSPQGRCTSRSKTPHQCFPLFYPAVAPQPYDKITAHLNCLHVCKKTVVTTGSSLI
jgi:hypothetical protein